MNFEFGFGYDAADTAVFEVKGAEGDYAALIECKEEYLKEWGLWTSFISEYRSEWPTWQEWLEVTPERLFSKSVFS